VHPPYCVVYDPLEVSLGPQVTVPVWPLGLQHEVPAASARPQAWVVIDRPPIAGLSQSNRSGLSHRTTEPTGWGASRLSAPAPPHTHHTQHLTRRRSVVQQASLGHHS
jgi:hypothetical protein